MPKEGCPLCEIYPEEIDWQPILISKKNFEEFHRKNPSIKKPSCVSEYDDEILIIDMSRWSEEEKAYFIESRRKLYYSYKNYSDKN